MKEAPFLSSKLEVCHFFSFKLRNFILNNDKFVLRCECVLLFCEVWRQLDTIFQGKVHGKKAALDSCLRFQPNIYTCDAFSISDFDWPPPFLL